jgi:hypothetical protein
LPQFLSQPLIQPDVQPLFKQEEVQSPPHELVQLAPHEPKQLPTQLWQLLAHELTQFNTLSTNSLSTNLNLFSSVISKVKSGSVWNPASSIMLAAFSVYSMFIACFDCLL